MVEFDVLVPNDHRWGSFRTFNVAERRTARLASELCYRVKNRSSSTEPANSSAPEDGRMLSPLEALRKQMQKQ